MCRQMGHEMVDCQGAPKPIEGKWVLFLYRRMNLLLIVVTSVTKGQ